MSGNGRAGAVWAVMTALLLCLPLQGQAQQAREVPPVLEVDNAERPVQLRDALLDVTLDGAQATTVLTLEFFNPNPRVLEGRLQLPLAEGQQVSGFALDIQGRMREAVPVPKERGRVVFEQIQRRQVDPGLLEQVAGNVFQLRVHPIPARGGRKVRIVLQEDLRVVEGHWRWQLPLQAVQGAGRVRMHVVASGGAAPVWRQAPAHVAWRVDGQGAALLDWAGVPDALGRVVRIDSPVSTMPVVSVGQWNGRQYLSAQIPVERALTRRVLPRRVGVVWDASASATARDHAAELRLLDGYLRALDTATVELTVLRDVAEPVRRFEVRGGDWRALRAALLDVVYDGGTDLSRWMADPRVQEYLLFSDGQSTLGAQAAPELHSTQRLYAVTAQVAGADNARLTAMADATGGRLLALAEAGVEASLQRLLGEHVRVRSIHAPGLHGVLVSQERLDEGWLQITGWSAAPLDDAQITVELTVPGARQPRVVRIGTRSALHACGRALATRWATMQLQRWRASPALYRERSAALAQTFGLVDAQTSLIVLEDVADYVTHQITPPAELQAEYAHALKQVRREAADTDAARLESVVARFEERRAWWATDWDAHAKEAEIAEAREAAAQRPEGLRARRMVNEPRPVDMVADVPAPASPRLMPPPTQSMAPPPPASPVMEMAASDADGVQGSTRGGIRVQLAPWQPDSDDATALRDAPADAVYPLYLQQRAGHAGSTAYLLDVADILLERGQRALALRVLSNLAELQLEDRHLLRVLGYRLLQAGEPDVAVDVLRHVQRIADEEPQSHRDLGLALDAAGRPQEAIAHLYDVVRRPWDTRFNGIALIALDELNAIIARERPRRPLRTDGMDPRLLHALPLDLRVVLAWDSDNSDMDLWVTDPDGERAYYGHRLTRMGGEMSQDFTGGYGPEQFSLRHAKPGVYRVEANFFGERQPLLAGATTLSLRLTTQWGHAGQCDHDVILRLKERTQTVLVGEFTVGAQVRGREARPTTPAGQCPPRNRAGSSRMET